MTISGFARSAIDAVVAGYRQPRTFRAIGGTKLFRDEVFANMRFTFSSDHRYYRKHGVYDFPNRKVATVALGNILRFIAATVPAFKKGYLGMLPGAMTMNFRKTLERARKETAMNLPVL
jgi:hypothetical protein